MYRENIAPGEYYHIYNRGVNKQIIFHSDRDYIRFLFYILQYQYSSNVYNINRYVTSYVKHRMFNIGKDSNSKRLVELNAFCIMPNHFHILAKELVDGGISKYMQRVLNAYTKYSNTKYKNSGHVFQGPYKIVHVETNNQLLYLSAYIHRNPLEIKKWASSIENYPWSSLSDYLGKNKYDNSLEKNIILEQFKTGGYENFIKTNTAKIVYDSGLMLD